MTRSRDNENGQRTSRERSSDPVQVVRSGPVTDEEIAVAQAVFAGLLNIMMIVTECREDMIQAGMGEGPINFVAEKLIKPKYLLGPKHRCAAARTFYCNQNGESDIGQKRMSSVKIKGKLHGSGIGYGIQKAVFRNRRLPNLRLGGREANRIWKWIDDGFQDDRLSVSGRKAAFAVFALAQSKYLDIKALSNYTIRPRRTSSGGTSQMVSVAKVSTGQGLASENADNAKSAGPSIQAVQDNGRCGTPSTAIISGSQEETHGLRTSACTQRDSIQANDNSFRAFLHQAETVCVSHPIASLLLAQGKKMSEAAADDKLFFIICKSVDPRDDHRLRLACIAVVFLQEIEAEGGQCSSLLMDALLFVIADKLTQRSRVPDRAAQEAQAARKRRLDEVVPLLKKSRRLNGKLPYESMDWEVLRRKGKGRDKSEKPSTE